MKKKKTVGESEWERVEKKERKRERERKMRGTKQNK